MHAALNRLADELPDGALITDSDIIERYRRDSAADPNAGDLTPCVGHAESRKVGGGSEMIHHDGKEKLP